jgi:hypothetical protein
MSDPATTATTPPRTMLRSPRSKAPPIGFFVRSFTMPDGREIVIDKRSIAFATPHKEAPATQTIVAVGAPVRAVPVVAPLTAVLDWWLAKNEGVAS